ncbi:MAG TPA: hypothetical protein PLW76_06775 [Clostridia bacterium]|nr:hypothetical protein [Clostridia bacterium]
MSLFDELINFEKNPSSSAIKPVEGTSGTAKKAVAQAPKAPPPAKNATPSKKPESHTHPASEGASVKKVDYAKYAGEGCEEHYTDRYIAQPFLKEKETKDLRGIARAIVIGEVLSAPRAKKPWRPK